MHLKKELLMFLMVGTVAALVHLSMVWIIVSATELGPLQANIVGFLGALNISYLGHSRFTFNKLKKLSIKTFAQFAIIASTGFLVNQITYYYGLKWFGVAFYMPILMVVLVMVAVFTFVFSKLWVFAISEHVKK